MNKRLPHDMLEMNEQFIRNRTMDKTCQVHVLLAMKHYAEALKLGTKHVYRALPRLLSIWFEVTSSRSAEGMPELQPASASSLLSGRVTAGKRYMRIKLCDVILLTFCCCVQTTLIVAVRKQMLSWHKISSKSQQ